MKRYGFFGGVFDPVHIGHCITAQAVHELAGLDITAFIPSATPPHKRGMTLFTAEERYGFLEAAVAGSPSLTVSGIEMRRRGPSYTIETIRELKADYPGYEICFIMGRDNLHEIQSWHEPNAILDESTVLVMERPLQHSKPIPEWLEERITMIDVPLVDVSSTHIRERLEAGRSIRYLVPEACIEPIEAALRART